MAADFGEFTCARCGKPFPLTEQQDRTRRKVGAGARSYCSMTCQREYYRAVLRREGTYYTGGKRRREGHR